MYKELVEKHLLRINEAEDSHPAKDLAKDIKSKDSKINKDAAKEAEKKLKDMQKSNISASVTDKPSNKAFNPPKTNIAGEQKKYHDEIELGNDNLDLVYDTEGGVSQQFKDRTMKAVKGDTTMGNKVYTGKENGNTEPVWGASDAEYGDKLVKTKINRAKDISQDPQKGGGTNGGPDGVTHRETALTKTGKAKTATTPFTTKAKDDSKKIKNESIDNNNNQISENKMKRLRFKKPFDGMNNALNIIPETYRVDKKVFEMTDGNETYKVRWEGSLSEGKAIVLQASNQQFISEDVNKIKHLMGYKSADTLGIVRGNARLDEDVKFKEFNEKMKLMVESKLDEKKKSEIAEKAKKMDEEQAGQSYAT